MATTLSPIYIAKSQEVLFLSSSDDTTLTIDFRLGLGEAVLLYQSELFYQRVNVGSPDDAQETASAALMLSLHRRVGTLASPVPIQPGPDTLQITQDEVLHQCVWNYWLNYTTNLDDKWFVSALRTNQVGQDTTQYIQQYGKPLLLSGDLTLQMHAFSNSGLYAWYGIGARVHYQFVKPSKTELMNSYWGRTS